MTVRRRAGARPERERRVAGSVAGRLPPVGPAPVVPALAGPVPVVPAPAGPVPVVPAPAGSVPVGLATVAAPGNPAAGGAAGRRRGGRPGRGR